MKITIDTSHTPHSVEIEGSCTIGELIEFLGKYYGDFTWQDIRISGKGYNISLPQTIPWHQPMSPWGQTNPVIYGDTPGLFQTRGTIGTGVVGVSNANLTGTTITYDSATNMVTNNATGATYTLGSK